MRVFGYDFTLKRASTEKHEERGRSLNGTEVLQILGNNSTNVSDKNVLGLSPVWAAIRYISEGVAALPLGVYSKTDSGIFPKEEHPLSYLISERPHNLYSKFDFLCALVANACLGDGFARIHFDEITARPRSLELLPRTAVTPRFDNLGNMVYDVAGTMGGKTVFVTLQDYEMLHIKGVSFNGLQGEKITVTHRDGFAAGISSQKFGRKYFENGAHTSGALIYPIALAPDQYKTAGERIKAQYAGAENAGKTMLLDGNVKYERFSAGPNDAALVDFRNLSVQDTARIFKMPLHMLSSLDRSTYSNVEQQELDFYQHTLPPWTEKIQSEFNYKLFQKLEREKRRAFTMFDYTFVRMGDSDGTSKMISSTIQNGVMSQNEWRKRLMLPVLDEGGRTWVQQNMMPIDMANDVLTNKYTKKEPGKQLDLFDGEQITDNEQQSQ